MGSSNLKSTYSTTEELRQALYHLHDKALEAGWAFPAHFIDVAAEAMQFHVYDDNIDPANEFPVPPIGPETALARHGDSPEPSDGTE